MKSRLQGSTFDASLTDPQKNVPGNTMPVPEEADAKQRTAIIDHLKSIP